MIKTLFEKKYFTPPILIALFAFFLYLPTITFSFVNYDDPWLIQNNILLHHVNFQSLQKIWFDFSTAQRYRLGSEYLPIRDLSVMLDYALFGRWIGGFHLTNIILYALFVFLLIKLLEKWLKDQHLAWLSALIFAAHPIHVESVAWLSERKGLLAAVFIALSLLSFHRFALERRWLSWLWSAIFLIFAIWSKSLAIVLIAVIAVFLWFYPPNSRSIKDNLTSWTGWILLVIIGFIAFLPTWFVGQQTKMIQPFHGGSWKATAWLMTRVHTTYILLLAELKEFAIQYPIFPHQKDPTATIFGLALFIIIVLLALLSLFKKKWHFVGLLAWLWLIFLAPVSQLIFPLQNYIADRYMFLPSIVWSLFVAQLFLSISHKKFRLYALTLLLIFSTFLTYSQIYAWESSENLYKQALVANPKNLHALLQLAQLANDKGDLKSAWKWTLLARKYYPNHHKVLLKQGLLLLKIGRRHLALQLIKRAAQHPTADKASSNYALLLAQNPKTLKQALFWAQRAVRIRPNYPHNQRVLGVVFMRLHRFQKARQAFQKALQLEPFSAQNHYNLALALIKLKQYQQALPLLKKAFQLSPNLRPNITKIFKHYFKF